MNESNPWNNVPLTDYELHMQHESVGQAKLLNLLTSKYLKAHAPKNVRFLGVSGGNGLEHIDIDQVSSVCAIDINNEYLKEAGLRFGGKIRQLHLVNDDISSSNVSYIKADFIWAALIFEYVDMERCFQFMVNNAAQSCTLIATVQSNNGVQTISKTGVESIKSVASIFKIIDKNDLQARAAKFGFDCISSEENFLPNGKSLITYQLRLR